MNAIWEQRATGPRRWRFLPTGYVDLIFRVGPKLKQIRGKSLYTAMNPSRNFAFLSGLHTRPFDVRFTRFHFIGIQMQPVAVNAIFGVHCSEVRDWALDGNLLLRDRRENAIQDRLLGNEIFQQKARWLEEYMLDRLRDATELTFARQLMTVIDKVLRPPHTNQSRIEDLTGYSRIHTYRLFKKWFGVSPLKCVQLYRYVRSLNHLHLGHPDRNLTEVAYQHGYYDQAHFIRVFREYTGMTPGEYRQNKSDLPAQLSG